LQICYNTSLQDLILIPIAQFYAFAMLSLLPVNNDEGRCWVGLQR